MGHLAQQHCVGDQDLRADLGTFCSPGDQHVDIHDYQETDLMLRLIDARGHNIVFKFHMGGGQDQDLHGNARPSSHQKAHPRQIPRGDGDGDGPVLRKSYHPLQKNGGEGVDLGHIAPHGRHFPGAVLFQLDEVLRLIIPLLQHLADGGVHLHDHDIAGVGHGDLAGDTLEVQQGGSKKESDREKQQKKKGKAPVPKSKSRSLPGSFTKKGPAIHGVTSMQYMLSGPPDRILDASGDLRVLTRAWRAEMPFSRRVARKPDHSSNMALTAIMMPSFPDS